MKRTSSAQSRRNRIARYLMSFAFAGSFALASQLTAACDQCGSAVSCSQGCEEPACGFAEPTCGCGSTVCVGSCKVPNNPIMKTLDAVAGGIERVLGLDQCNKCGCDSGCDSGCTVGCDDACDSAFAQELMVPIQSAPAVSVPHHHSIQPAPSLPTSPSLPTVPPIVSDPSPMTQPRTRNPPVPTPSPTPVPVDPPSDEKPADDTNIFDSLDDPFGDDEVRSSRPYRQVRPTSHDAASRLRKARPGYAPIFTSPRQTNAGNSAARGTKRSHLQNSRRRVSSARVQPASHTDALQPLTDPVPELRPVKHPEFRTAPVAPRSVTTGPPKMATGKVLAPYRRSNR